MNKLTHISIWTNLLPSQREDMFAGSKKLRKYWTNLSNKIAAQDAEDTEESRKARFERNYLWNLIARFKRTLDRVDDESKDEIRQDLEDVLFRMKPWRHESRNETIWGGWARMALLLDSFQIVEVGKPFVGDKSPSVVKGEFAVNVGRRTDIKQEWEKAYEKRPQIQGDIRRYRVFLDPNQYRIDMENRVEKGAEDVYYTFNLVVRRDPKTNNFKAVLATMRQLLNTECVVPDWLTDIVLGYGEPDSAHYSKLAGMQPGLTMVVGPPGTGKTDVAVQIIANIYHNWPQQRTLIVTHSNQALNQLFEKIIALDVDERHLLRMGHGEEGLETEKDFSRYGRVNHVLKERLRLLSEVERLQHAMNVIGDVSYTCENAGHFFRFTVCRAWDDFMEKCAVEKDGLVAEVFPFTGYFSDINPLFTNLGEAEYAVALFTYMRIIGYPADKISIITTYNGQAQLIRDVVERRCANNPLIGVPAKVSTVDKYQGQQNDYIILSLSGEQSSGEVITIENTVHMSTFVHDFYVSNMESMRVNYEKAMEEYRRQVQQLTLPPTPDEPVMSEAERKAEEKKAKAEKAPEQEKDIMFESMDFERLEEVPKY
ncbi:hypothetical protein TELCIR_16872 [Teladorsagia circumcincta]|uniref:DNA2/NAM7 helicase-like C-terminal domain-containing protein n=1 Tax=Teladorsagia circumcincta TaxID=45464 RepID=A0A2G9TWH2_TELCI|nr:hypothetical protein TELCIR_16872 [Teladorsagia circumcincta]